MRPPNVAKSHSRQPGEPRVCDESGLSLYPCEVPVHTGGGRPRPCPHPRVPPACPGDYISQHRLLGPREGEREKKVFAKHSRNALPAGAGRALGPPGPSMAEPLLRKTFSRLRGREKLPRKKSDAKERGEPRTDGPGEDGWGGAGWGDPGRKRAPPTWTEFRPRDPRRAGCKGARGAPSLRIRGGRGSRPGGPSWVGEGRGPLFAARPGMPAPRAGEAREGARACRKRGPGRAAPSRAEQAGCRRGGAAGLGRAEAPGALEGLGEAEEGRRPLDTHWTASSSRKRPWCAAGETEARAGRGALARTQLPWHRAETTPGPGPGWVTGSVPAWETNWRPRGQDVREQAGARSEAAGEARDHAHRKWPVSEGPSQAREPGGAEGDRCGAPGQGTGFEFRARAALTSRCAPAPARPACPAPGAQRPRARSPGPRRDPQPGARAEPGPGRVLAEPGAQQSTLGAERGQATRGGRPGASGARQRGVGGRDLVQPHPGGRPPAARARDPRGAARGRGPGR